MSPSVRENSKEDILQIDIGVDTSNAREEDHPISIVLFLVVIVLP
jgi:hypothetical protein